MGVRVSKEVQPKVIPLSLSPLAQLSLCTHVCRHFQLVGGGLHGLDRHADRRGARTLRGRGRGGHAFDCAALVEVLRLRV